MKVKRFVPVILLSIVMNIMFSPATCQTNTTTVINQKKEHVVKSTINGTAYYLSVSLPMHYSKIDTTHYPVLYMLDGGLAFPIAHAARTALDMFGGLEDLIIVSIEYKWDKSLTPWMTTRWKDYTPSKDEKLDVNPGYLKMFDLQPGALSSGGGKSIDFLKSLSFPTKKDKEDILYNNAARFLKIK